MGYTFPDRFFAIGTKFAKINPLLVTWACCNVYGLKKANISRTYLLFLSAALVMGEEV